jgi:hypothetical protein
MMIRLFTAAVLLLAGSCATAQKKVVDTRPKGTLPFKDTSATDYKLVGAPLPPFKVVTPQGKSITNANVPAGKHFFLMIFNPTCEHCEDVTRNLELSYNRFAEGQILLTATAGMMPYMEFFGNTTKVFDYPKIQVGVDSANLIDRIYNYGNLPQINVYSPAGKLVKIFNGGQTTADSLAVYLKK